MKRLLVILGIGFLGFSSGVQAQKIYVPGDPYDPDAIYEDEENLITNDPAAEKRELAPPPIGRAAFYYAVLDPETKANQPDLTIEQAIADSLNDFLVINYFNDKAQYSNYQRAILRRAVAHLSSRLSGRDAKLLDVMAFTADDQPVYAKEAQEAWNQNTLGGFAAPVDSKPVLPYGQVFIHGQLVYDFAVTLNAKDGKMVANNARAIQSSLQRIVRDLRDLPPLFDDETEVSGD